MGALSLDILGPALVAGILILATHVPLGTIVLGRGIIFIDIALAQVAALGVVFGTLMWGAASFWVIQLAAVTAAIAHLAHSTPPEFLFAATDFNSYVTKSIAIGAPKRKDGMLAASTAPGLGVTPLSDALGEPVFRIG